MKPTEQEGMKISLAGKVAIITGGLSGIGAATVRRFLDCGVAGVVAVDKQTSMPDELVTYQQRFGDRLITLQGDVGVEDTAQQYTTRALQQFGRIDILLNNAGTAVVRPIHEHTPEEWDRVINSNLKSVYWSARHVVPVMMKQQAGLILMTGSISGEVGIPGQGAYGPSKGALHQMTKQMAIEYAPFNIRVNAVGCGTIDTPLLRSAAVSSGNEEAFLQGLRSHHPIGRIATPDEVAAFYAFLASDYATFFTGSILMLDGGFTAH